MPMKNDFAMSPAVIAGTPAPTMPPRKEMTIQDLWGILSRRRGIVLGVLLLTIAAAATLFATSTRLYKGAAEIQVQKESADTLSMDTMMGPGTQSDAVDSNITLQTQAQILQSDSLAVQVVKELNLEQSPDFRAPLQSHWLGPGPVCARRHRRSRTSAPGRRRRGAARRSSQTFESHLKVRPSPEPA